MDFDFNIILVPITVLLGVIWLLDILMGTRWLRDKSLLGRGSHSTSDKRLAEKASERAQDNLQEKKSAYEQALQRYQLHTDAQDDMSIRAADNSVKVNDVPTEVMRTQREYRDAKREASRATSQLVALQPTHKSNDTNFLVRWSRDYFPVLAAVLIVRSFIIEPFNIPSSSMVPTLYTGDFVAVNKYAYGIRLPLTYTKVLDTGSPERGDVAVFRYPNNPRIYYIKRIIGLPGDTVSFSNGRLTINEQPVPTQQVTFDADKILTEQVYTPVAGQMSSKQAIGLARAEEAGARYFQEQLGDHTYLRRYMSPRMQYEGYSEFLQRPFSAKDSWQVVVPEGNYFVMGDNTDRSEDGRFWGFVPDDNLSGKAVYVWMHKQPGLTNLPTFDYNRSID